MQYAKSYAAPTLTVDLVLFQIVKADLCVLLIKRPNEPFQGMWALPGGYNPEGETTLEALERIIRSKVGIDAVRDLAYLEQLYTFDTVARDPRGHAVSVTYMGSSLNISLKESANTAAFFPVSQLPDIAYDHVEIIRYGHKRLSAKISHTNAAFAFLREAFTLSELQSIYEAIYGHGLDKRNFRKKFLSLNLIRDTGKMEGSGAHRPARLYAFNSRKLEEASRGFQ